MITKAILPKTTGAVSFRRVLGSADRDLGSLGIVEKV